MQDADPQPRLVRGPQDRQAPGQQRARPVEVAGRQCAGRDGVPARGHLQRPAVRPHRVERLAGVLPRRRTVPGGEVGARQRGQRPCEWQRPARRTVQRDRLAGQRTARRRVAALDRELRGDRERGAAVLRRPGADLAQQFPGGGVLPAFAPAAGQDGGEQYPLVRAGPGHGGVQGVPLGVQQAEHVDRREWTVGERYRPRHEPVDQSPAGRVHTVHIGQSLVRVPPHRSGQPEPSRGGTGHQHGPRFQHREEVDHVGAGTHRRGDVEPERTVQYGQSAQRVPLRGAEWFVAGRHGDAQVPGQQRERVVQPGPDIRDGQVTRPPGGQLDGERVAVQPGADRGDVAGVAVVQRDTGPADEQADRRGPQQPRRIRLRAVRQRQRADHDDGLSGNVQRPGNYEVELGTPVREIIYDLAGGPPHGRKVKCFFPGGSSAPVLTADHLDLPFTYEAMAEAGSMLGTASVIVVDDSQPLVPLALRLAEFYRHESCGKCVPCREGTNWTVKALERIDSGEATPLDLEIMGQVQQNIMGNCLCVLGDSMAMPVGSMIRHFREEFEEHIENARHQRELAEAEALGAGELAAAAGAGPA